MADNEVIGQDASGLGATDESTCAGAGETGSDYFGFRIGAIFILLATSALTTFFPVISRRVPRAMVPQWAFNFAKFFGSGVILATAFIHLLEPGADNLHSECLNENFHNYPFAFLFSMVSALLTFMVELFSFRWGAGLAERLAYDPRRGGHHHAMEHNGPLRDEESGENGRGVAKLHHDDSSGELAKDNKAVMDENLYQDKTISAAASQILGVLILEFGIIFHSVIIGITLGVTDEFVILFVVIIFHQMFEGLGLGARLALLPLPRNHWIPWIGALAYALVTPIGLAIGLGVRESYNPGTATANIVTGTFDSVSSGILFYVAFVELIAHEFVFNERMRTAPLSFVLLSTFELWLGASLMALLGTWA